MKDFPDFMKNEKNRVPGSAQNTEDIEGYYYEGLGGGQMAFWTCYSDRESKKHKHDFDEYTIHSVRVSTQPALRTGKSS